MLGIKNLMSHQKEQELNREAESLAVRRKFIGDKADQQAEERNGEMGDNLNLGDTYHPAPIIIPPQKDDSLLKNLLLIGLGGIGVWGASQVLDKLPAPQPAPLTQPREQTEVSVGFGSPEDYDILKSK